MPRLLELFSGTKSVSTAVEKMFDEVVSIDIVDKYKPTEVVDILEWNYKKYPSGYFDCIWASPPCTEYSRLKQNTGMVTDLEKADTIVLKVFEIIDYFNPKKWWIENPQTGILKDRFFMDSLPYYDVDYCCYSDWGYKKRTRIWTNIDFIPKLCKGKGYCPNMEGRFHKVSFGGQGRPKDHVYKVCPSGDTAYRIPPQLIVDLFI